MKIGYSFWGFLGAGITDTPDGGRSHRRTLTDGLLGLDHDIVFLQDNRDLHEAGDDLRDHYTWDAGLPEIDVLFLEWRWQIPGRNNTVCGSPGHTCDLHRQEELIRHYALRRSARTVLWDKDQQLSPYDALRGLDHIIVCEPALHPGPGAVGLLFPVADGVVDAADPAKLAALPRDLPLVYVGNQYDRDESFDTYFAPAAATTPHLVAGRWPRTKRWPQVNFVGRTPFAQVEQLHRRAKTTILLAPDRYAARGQFTQRIFEAVLAGCLPLAPAHIRSADAVVPPELIITDGGQAIQVIDAITRTAGTRAHADQIRRCLDRLEIFRLSHQLATLTRLLGDRIPTASPTGPHDR